MNKYNNKIQSSAIYETNDYLTISENILNYFIDDDKEFNKFIKDSFQPSNDFIKNEISITDSNSFPKLGKDSIPMKSTNVNKKLDFKKCFANSVQSSNTFTKQINSEILPLCSQLVNQSSEKLTEPKLTEIVLPCLKLRKRPIPLKNHGVNCYMNSAMQSLLVPFCDLSKLQSELPKQCHAFSLMKSFISSFESGKQFSIYDFIKRNSDLKYFGNELSWNKQEDAHEFLNQFLDKIDEELSKYHPSYSSPFTISHDARLFCETCKQSNISKPNIINSQVILVDIGRNLNEMINNCYKDCVDVYNCENCSNQCKASSSGKFTKLSDYLVVCCKRFGRDEYWRSIKIDNEMKIEENIKVLNGIDNNLTTYELISIVNHIGSVSSGHYYSYVKYNNQWFKANDEQIDSVSFGEVREKSKSTNYINIYRKL